MSGQKPLPQGTPVFGDSAHAHRYGVPASSIPQAGSSPGGPPGFPSSVLSEPERLNLELQELREKHAILEKELSKVRAVSGPVAVLIDCKGDKGLVTVASGQYATIDLKGVAGLEPGVGMRLAKDKDGLKFVEALEIPPGGGRAVTVEKIHGKLFEYMVGGDTRTSRVGRFTLKPNDRVVLDPLGEIAVHHLGRVQAKSLTQPTNVSWSDIGGLEDVKRELQEAVEDPIRYRALYKQFGQRAPKGLLLAGPPGTGKTLLAMACATALAELHGKSALEGGFIPVAGPEILNKFIGESEATVRQLFTSAKEHEREHGYPAVIFLDEADSLLGRRGATRWEGMERTIVPQFLALMDGLESTGAFVIVATNRPNMLDPALLRDGRLDRRIFVPRPDRVSTESILRVHLAKRPGDARALAALGASLLFSEVHVLKRLVLADGGVRVLGLRDVISGALAYGLVHRAAQLALRRAKLEASQGSGKEVLLTEEDMVNGTLLLVQEERLSGHDDELGKLGAGLEVVRVETPST